MAELNSKCVQRKQQVRQPYSAAAAAVVMSVLLRSPTGRMKNYTGTFSLPCLRMVGRPHIWCLL